ncbi:MAG TPA: transposase [Methylophilaceae bacterium]|jgi:putative transposase
MPRRARLSLPGVTWHILQRGNNRADCFFADEDYRYYLTQLPDLCTKFDCALHAYVLMSNQVHLLLTPKHPDSAAQLMKNLGQRYVQYVNRTYRRSGTLWEGRFRSCMMQGEKYTLEGYRYIELKPLRKGIAARPQDYPWSSYHSNALGVQSELIQPHREYLNLGENDTERQAAYAKLLETPLDNATIQSIRAATNGNFVLGDPAFQQEISSKLKRRVTPGKIGRPRKKEAI